MFKFCEGLQVTFQPFLKRGAKNERSVLAPDVPVIMFRMVSLFRIQDLMGSNMERNLLALCFTSVGISVRKRLLFTIATTIFSSLLYSSSLHSRFLLCSFSEYNANSMHDFQVLLWQCINQLTRIAITPNAPKAIMFINNHPRL